MCSLYEATRARIRLLHWWKSGITRNSATDINVISLVFRTLDDVQSERLHETQRADWLSMCECIAKVHSRSWIFHHGSIFARVASGFCNCTQLAAGYPFQRADRIEHTNVTFCQLTILPTSIPSTCRRVSSLNSGRGPQQPACRTIFHACIEQPSAIQSQTRSKHKYIQVLPVYGVVKR